MKLWTLGYNEENKANFPQVLYKGKEIDVKLKLKLLHQIFKLFYLTHRDAREQIQQIEKNTSELPYAGLYNLILPPKKVEFQKEYLVDLLNYFSIEIDEKV